MNYTNPRLYETYDRDLTKKLEDRLLNTQEGPDFSPNAISILEKRYFRKDAQGNLQEDGKSLLARVAANIAYPDLHYGASEEQTFETAQTFYQMMASREFMPNSPTLMNAGGPLQQLSACFVLPIEDNMRSIFGGVYNTSQVHMSGGGTGFSFSYLRMKNDYVSSTSGRASGPVSFLKAYNEATTAVNQGGFRRGANMGILKIDHPDIMEFIYAKGEEGKYPRFNFSVALTDEFMEAVKQDKYYLLRNPKRDQLHELTVRDIEEQRRCVEQGVLSSEKELSMIIAEDGKTVIAQIPLERDYSENVTKVRQIPIGLVDEMGRITYNARKVFDEITTLAHKNGEPGVFFIDTANKYNPTPHVGKIESTNPCGEQPLLPYEACNLGHINLRLMLTEENGQPKIDYQKLRTTVYNAVHFLDNVIDMSNFPDVIDTRDFSSEKITQIVQGNRKIGLGIMGFADLLAKLRIPYDTEQAIKIAEQVMGFVQQESVEASKKLAEERGVFPNFEGSTYDSLELRVRNAARTSIAPTGTTGQMIEGASAGIEPYFYVIYVHTDADGKSRTICSDVLLEELEKQGIELGKVENDLKSGKSFNELTYIPEETKRIFVTANEVSPEMHVRMQAEFQKHVDAAISKTINMPHEATVEDVKRAYLLAHELGCKGVTVYRDGSRQLQVLTKVDQKEGMKTLEDAIREGALRGRDVRGVHDLPGRTYDLETGCGTIFVNLTEDEYGPTEVFVNMNPPGGCADAQTASSGISLSLGLHANVDPMKYIKHFRSIRCPNSNGLLNISSCPQAIANALHQFLEHTGRSEPNNTEGSEKTRITGKTNPTD